MKTFFSRFGLLTFALGITANISACGQKGPLYLPTKPAAISTPYPTATPKEDDRSTNSSPAQLPGQSPSLTD